MPHGSTAAYASVRAGVAPVEPWGITSFHASDQDRSFKVGPETQPATDLSQYQDELVGLLQSPIANLVGLLDATLQEFVGLIDARAEQVA